MATPFQKEAWTEYALGILILFLRIFVRCRNISLNWDGDDYFAAIAVFFWAVWKKPIHILTCGGQV